MAELSVDDVVEFTGGRLEDNDVTQHMLDAALSAARGFVDWHVSPVRLGDKLVLDGPDSRVLVLPTLKLVKLNKIIEDDVELDLTDLRVSTQPNRTVRIRKKAHHQGWTCHYSAIEVDLDHGYTEVEAADWRQAILELVDAMSTIPIHSASGRSDADLRRKQVDDVEYQWDPGVYASLAKDALYSMTYIFGTYQIPPVEFM